MMKTPVALSRCNSTSPAVHPSGISAGTSMTPLVPLIKCDLFYFEQTLVIIVVAFPVPANELLYSLTGRYTVVVVISGHPTHEQQFWYSTVHLDCCCSSSSYIHTTYNHIIKLVM